MTRYEIIVGKLYIYIKNEIKIRFTTLKYKIT